MTTAGSDTPDVSLTWVRAHNAGPKTLSGTYTYLLTAAHTVWIVDPGPEDRRHAQAVVDAAVSTGARRVGGIVLTHHHADHSGAVAMVRRALSVATGISVPVWCAEPDLIPGASAVPGELMADGTLAGVVYHLPGHTSDSLGIRTATGAMLTGDTLLGGSPTTISDGGSLADYLQSLQILRVMAMDGRISGLYPGHGQVIEGAEEAFAEIEGQIRHRAARIAQVRGARERGVLTIKRLLEDIYEPQFAERRAGGASEAEIQTLREAATGTLKATLEYLRHDTSRRW